MTISRNRFYKWLLSLHKYNVKIEGRDERGKDYHTSEEEKTKEVILMEFRDYQKQIIKDGVKIISVMDSSILLWRFVQVNFYSFRYSSKVILQGFICYKEKAISSIEADYQSSAHYWLDVINCRKFT